jgi:hypothetical protein
MSSLHQHVDLRERVKNAQQVDEFLAVIHELRDRLVKVNHGFSVDCLCTDEYVIVIRRRLQIWE